MLPCCVKALSGVTSKINYNTKGFETSTGAMVEKTRKPSDQLHVWKKPTAVIKNCSVDR